MEEEEKPLSFYSPEEGMSIHVIDSNPKPEVAVDGEEPTQVENNTVENENSENLPSKDIDCNEL